MKLFIILFTSWMRVATGFKYPKMSAEVWLVAEGLLRSWKSEFFYIFTFETHLQTREIYNHHFSALNSSLADKISVFTDRYVEKYETQATSLKKKVNGKMKLHGIALFSIVSSFLSRNIFILTLIFYLISSLFWHFNYCQRIYSP